MQSKQQPAGPPSAAERECHLGEAGSRAGHAGTEELQTCGVAPQNRQLGSLVSATGPTPISLAQGTHLTWASLQRSTQPAVSRDRPTVSAGGGAVEMAWDPGARLPDIEQRGHEPRQSLLCVQIHTSAAFSFIPAELWTAPPSSLADISVVFHFSKARPARSQTEEPARPSPRPRLKPFGGVGRHPGIPRACVAAPLSLQQPVTDPPFSGRLTPRSHLSSASGGGEGTCKPHRLLLRGFIQTQVCWVQKTRHS